MPAIVHNFESRQYSSYNTDVAILYADIVGFTRLCASLTPQTVIVSTLRDVFASLDTAAKARSVCKLETIGDAYWAAANLPEHSTNDGDDAIIGIAAFAHDIHRTMARFKVGPDNVPLMARIGIAYGEVATGVVGRISPRYHAFGSVVVTSQKMESASPIGGILVTPEFSMRLQLAVRRQNADAVWFTKVDTNNASSPLVLHDTNPNVERVDSPARPLPASLEGGMFSPVPLNVITEK